MVSLIPDQSQEVAKPFSDPLRLMKVLKPTQ